MNAISTNVKDNLDGTIFTEAEKKYSITIRKDIKLFLSLNAGGYPVKDMIIVDGDEYEVRAFLSLDSEDENYCITKPLDFFLNRTKAKIVPIGIDSGDNYYCVNNENGKVYYWSSSEDSYYCIAETIDEFVSFFQ
ncbi:MAG: SMI1/KNR4 family protein [Ruminococcus sp.]|nr:SMI1/KNR4 family protein [Ruminococcus sp.]